VGIALAGCSTTGSAPTALLNASEVAAGKAAAEQAIATLLGQPSAFPVSGPLAEVPTGKTVVFVDCGSPFCGLLYSLVDGASQVLGVELVRVTAGQAADTVFAAFNSVVSQAPDAVIVAGINVELWNT